MKHLLVINILCQIMFLLSGCYYSHPNKLDHWVSTDGQTVDSINFMIAHHYWEGFNFETTDSLHLELQQPGTNEDSESTTLTINPREHLVVANIRYIPKDSIDSVWVKVASEQFSQGWIREKTLLGKVTPSDPISKFINNFSNSRTLIFVGLLGLFILLVILQMICRRKQSKNILLQFYQSMGFLAPGGWKGTFKSVYPTMLCLIISGSAGLYGTIQKFVPTTWVEFYFHPTLNPFSLDIPPILALFIASVWIFFIIGFAVVIDLLHQESFENVLVHTAGLACICIILYLIFTLTVQVYIGYPLLAAYWGYTIWRYDHIHQKLLKCGNCGLPLEHLGYCPHCGALNK